MTAMMLDGQPVSLSDLKALALQPYGHFTSMLVERGGVRGLNWHLERLRHDAQVLFAVDLDTDAVRRHVRDAADAEGGRVVARATVYDPQMELGRPADTGQPHILVTTRRAGVGSMAGVRLRSRVYARELPKVKHVGLFGALYQRRQAQNTGADDVLFTDADGTVSEVATSNIAVVRESGVTWPSAECLEGVTMRILRQILTDQGITWMVAPVTAADLAGAAAMVSNAAVGVRAVSEIDGVALPDPPLLDQLREAYTRFPVTPL